MKVCQKKQRSYFSYDLAFMSFISWTELLNKSHETLVGKRRQLNSCPIVTGQGTIVLN